MMLRLKAVYFLALNWLFILLKVWIMKKLLYLALILSFSASCYAKSDVKPDNKAKAIPAQQPNVVYNSAVVVDREPDGLDAFADIPLRVGGFVATAVGTGVFVAVAPIAGLISLNSDNDPTGRLIDYLILQPAHYMIDRPVGDFNYDSRLEKKKQ